MARTSCASVAHSARNLYVGVVFPFRTRTALVDWFFFFMVFFLAAQIGGGLSKFVITATASRLVMCVTDCLRCLLALKNVFFAPAFARS